MLTIDESSVAIKTPIATIASTAHLFARCEPAATGCWLSLMAGVRISSLLACVLSEITILLFWDSFCLMLVLFFSPEAVLNFTTRFSISFFQIGGCYLPSTRVKRNKGSFRRRLKSQKCVPNEVQFDGQSRRHHSRL